MLQRQLYKNQYLSTAAGSLSLDLHVNLKYMFCSCGFQLCYHKELIAPSVYSHEMLLVLFLIFHCKRKKKVFALMGNLHHTSALRGIEHVETVVPPHIHLCV